MGIIQACLTCGGICPPYFSQVSLGVGDPDARQYNLKVSPSWTLAFWGLTWTWGCVPRPLGFDSEQGKMAVWSSKDKMHQLQQVKRSICAPTTHMTHQQTQRRTLNDEGNLCCVLSMSVQGLAGVLSLISWFHCCEGQHATSYHSSGTHSVPWTTCNNHTDTPHQ